MSDISPSDNLVMAADANPLGGLASALQGYLGSEIKNQQDIATKGQEAQIDANKEIKVAKAQHEIDNPPDKGSGNDVLYLTPDQAEKIWPGMGRDLVTKHNAQNPQAPLTVRDAADQMEGITDSLYKLNKASAKSNVKHYLGNDPDGNAIFSDNSGNMFGPDGNVYSGKVLPKSSTMPTSQTRSSAEFATTILPHITEMRSLIQQADQKGFIGPASGRIYNQFLAGKVGSTGDDDADRLLGRLRAMDSLLKTGAMKVHFGSRGGQNMYEHFSEMLNTGKQSSSVLNGSLDTMEDFMKGYANAGKPGGPTEDSSDLASKKAALKAKLGI